MIGLEYVLNLSEFSHTQLAEKLGIRKQNINLWIKKKQGIPKKYLPILTEMFNVDAEVLKNDINQKDKILIQVAKLKSDLDGFEGAEEIFGAEENLLGALLGDVDSDSGSVEENILVSKFRNSLGSVEKRSEPSVEIMIMLLEYINDSSLQRVINIIGQLYELVEDDGAYDGDEINQSLFDLLL